MRNKNIFILIPAFLLLLVSMSCNEDDEPLAPIAGKWRGTMSEIQLKPFGLPIPISREDENFNAEIEFKSDGRVILQNNSETRQGTWQVNGDKLITDIDFSTADIKLDGTYTIESLTETTLVFYVEKDNQTITDPETGRSISGDIKATLHFQKI